MKNIVKYLLSSCILFVFIYLIISNSEIFALSLEQDYTADRGEYSCTFEEDSLYLDSLISSTAMFCDEHGGPYFFKRDTQIILTATVNGSTRTIDVTNGGTFTVWGKKSHPSCQPAGDVNLTLTAKSYSGMTTKVGQACASTNPRKVYATGRISYKEQGSVTVNNNVEAYILAEARANVGWARDSYPNIAWWNRSPGAEFIRDGDFDDDTTYSSSQVKSMIKEALESIDSEIASLNAEKKAIQEEIKSLQEQLSSTEDEIADLNTQINQLTSEIAANNTKINANNVSITEKQTLLSEKQTLLSSKQKERENLVAAGSSTEAIDTEIATLETEISRLESEISSLRTEVDNLNADNEDKTKSINAMKAQIQTLNNPDLHSTNTNDYSSSVSGIKEKINGLQEDIKEIDTQIQALEKDRKTLESTSAGKIKDAEDFEKLLKSLVVEKVTGQSGYTATTGEGLLEEAQIFESMHKVINNNYLGTVKDLTNVNDVKVTYNATSKKYLVGPFRIQYCEVYANKNQFSGITGTPKLTLYKDTKKISKDLGDGWAFGYFKENSGVLEAVGRQNYGTLGHDVPAGYNAYPHTGESFYIVIDYEEGINKLGGLTLNFRYLTASATYARIEGEIEKKCWEVGNVSWTRCTHVSHCGSENCSGHRCSDNTSASVTVSVSDAGTIPTQRLLRVHRAHRGYEQRIVTYQGNITTGSGGNGSSKLFVWQIDLTTTLAGNVWVDKDPQKDNSAVNGIKNSNVKEEKGIQNIAVTVYLYNSSGKKQKPAIAHNDNGTRISWPIYTDSSGYYEVNRLEAPGSGTNYFYVVEFEYDGQVYKNTIYLGDPNNITGGNTPQGLASVYKASAVNEENKYFNSSMAVEEVHDRYVFDQTFGEITGNSSINNGVTTGITNTTDVDGENTVANTGTISYYKGNYSNTDEANKNGGSGVVVSKLNSAAQNPSNTNQKVTSGSGYERYRMVASTYYNDTDTHGMKVTKSNFRIQYPLEGWTYKMNRKVSGSKRYINDYMLHINLGLMGRATTDVSVLKDLYKMTVVVNEQEMVQEFNSLGDTKNGYSDLKILLEGNRSQGYTLGLYNSDVAYSSKSRYAKAIKQVQDLKEYTELRVFVTYAIRVYNNSETNDVRINEITDYYDDTYKLVDTENSTMHGYKEESVEPGIYASIVGEDLKREEKLVADNPYYRVLSSDSTYVWQPTKAQNLSVNGVISSGNLTWSTNGTVDGMNKSTSTTLRGVRLKVNEYAEVFTTYEIDYEGFMEMAQNSETDITKRENRLLGLSKNNIAEVSNYSTFYSNLDITGGIYSAYDKNWVSGRVDKDSAPNNIKTSDLDDTSCYEDDTCLAIPLTVSIETIDRDMYGYVFEDKKNKDSNYDLTDGGKLKVGNGLYDTADSDILIPKVKVSMYEVINLGNISNGSGDVKYDDLEYYYEIPQEYYNNKVPVLTLSSNAKNLNNEDVKGNYYISGFLAGDYVLRFDYGTQTDSTAKVYATGDNGATNSTDVNVIKYNGQDYENTAFLSDTSYTSDSNTYSAINDKFLNLRTEEVNGIQAVIAVDDAKAYSVARDNESRRMVVDAYSRTIENDRGEILRDREASNDEFVKATKMFAETPIMQIEIFDPKELNDDVQLDGNDATSVVKSTSDVSSTAISEHTYHISNINFGLEERAKTDIDIEQYIQKIVLQKDGENIFSATLQENGEVIVSDADSAHIDKMTYLTHEKAFNPTEGLYQQGFYAISVEDEYLNGLTLKLTYKIKVLNNSEVDFTGYLSKYYVAREIVNKATYPPTTENYTEYLNELLIDDEEHGISTNSTLAEILKLYGDNENTTLKDLLQVDKSRVLTEKTENTGNNDKAISINDSIRPDIIVYGKYVGKFYYENVVNESPNQIYSIINYRNDGLPNVTINYDGDKVVRTTVDQLIDYVDINGSYDLSTQNRENRSWNLSGNIENTGERETIPSLISLVSQYSYRAINGVYNIYDEKDNALVTDVSSNIVITDNSKIGKMATMSGNEDTGDYASYLDRVLDENRVEYRDNYDDYSLINSNLGMELLPATADKKSDEDKSETTMIITTTKVTASDTDANNMKFDNLVEVLVYSNTTGRRDVTSVPGNAMALATKEDIGFWKAGYNSYEYWEKQGINDASDWTSYPEDDQYAPEYVTIIAPTGIALREYVKNVVIPITILSIILIVMIGAFGVKQYKIIKRRKEF